MIQQVGPAVGVVDATGEVWVEIRGAGGVARLVLDPAGARSLAKLIGRVIDEADAKHAEVWAETLARTRGDETS